MARTNINGDRSELSHMFVIVFFLQAVRVQDPPHGLPAAAASGLQLQEPRQGHSLERRKRKKGNEEEEEEEEEYSYREKTGRIIIRRGRGHLHLTKLFRCPLPTLKTVLFWFRLGVKKKCKDF